MHCVLKEWNDNIENQQNTNHRFTLSSSSALNFFKTPTKPALYTFYSKLHELLVAKVIQKISLLFNKQTKIIFSLHFILTIFYMNMAEQMLKYLWEKLIQNLLHVSPNFQDVQMSNGLHLFYILLKNICILVKQCNRVYKFFIKLCLNFT